MGIVYIDNVGNSYNITNENIRFVDGGFYLVWDSEEIFINGKDLSDFEIIIKEVKQNEIKMWSL